MTSFLVIGHPPRVEHRSLPRAPDRRGAPERQRGAAAAWLELARGLALTFAPACSSARLWALQGGEGAVSFSSRWVVSTAQRFSNPQPSSRNRGVSCHVLIVGCPRDLRLCREQPFPILDPVDDCLRQLARWGGSTLPK